MDDARHLHTVPAAPEGHDSLEHRVGLGGGPMLAEVTKAMVRLHSDYYGRGATKARTEWVGEDMLICVLRDCFTRVERTLIELGEHRSVRETRQVFQDAMRDRFSAAVEQIVGRKVIGFLSQISAEPECVVEIFMLEPASGPADGGVRVSGASASDRDGGPVGV